MPIRSPLNPLTRLGPLVRLVPLVPLVLGTLLLAVLPPVELVAQDPFPVAGPGVGAGEGVVEECTPAGSEGVVLCGVFRVDEDGEPGGRLIDLHFLVAEALEGPATEAVVFFTGGPGIPSIPPLRALSEMPGPMAELRRTRDLLWVDLRGTGRSGNLGCTVDYPGGVESRFEALFPLDHVAACRDTLAERAKLEQYTTSISVDDVERLRRWLGYERVNLSGGSYGTVVAQDYMRRYPSAVRTAFLTSVTTARREGYLQMARWLQQALDRLVAECEGQAECRRAYPELRGELDALFARFDDGPVPVTVEGRTIPFTAGNLGYALRGLLYSRAADIPAIVHRTHDGPLDELVDYYLERTGWVSSAWGGLGNHLSVLCPEDIETVTDAEVRAATRGTFLGDWVIGAYREACAIWPTASVPASFFDPVTADIPTLLVSGGRDPSTPPEGGDDVAEHLPRALHIVLPNAGHGGMTPCVAGLLVRLMQDGSLENVDPSCVDAAPPTRFRMP